MIVPATWVGIRHDSQAGHVRGLNTNFQVQRRRERVLAVLGAAVEATTLMARGAAGALKGGAPAIDVAVDPRRRGGFEGPKIGNSSPAANSN